MVAATRISGRGRAGGPGAPGNARAAFPAARATRTPLPAYACGGCYQRVSSQTRVYPALWVYPTVLSTLLLELVVAVELLAVAQSLRARVAPQEPVAKTHRPTVIGGPVEQ